MNAAAWVETVATIAVVAQATVFVVALAYALAPTKAGRRDRARQAGLRAVERELSKPPWLIHPDACRPLRSLRSRRDDIAGSALDRELGDGRR